VEIHSLTGADGGVTVLEMSAREDPENSGVRSAESFANWLAQRTFLSTSKVHAGQVDGHPAWIVDAVVRRGQPAGPATCNTSMDCYPIMLQGDYVIGAWEGITSRYMVLDLPGAGVTVVSSWGLDARSPGRSTT
jgi:hypothetical protein